MAVYQTGSARETEALGARVAGHLPGRILALTGELGSGKTTFVKGLAKGLGIKKRILSPSFVLVREYQLTGKPYTDLYHLDLYRLEGKSDIQGLGLEEIWQDASRLVVIEWAEKIKKVLPSETVEIVFEYLDKNKRKITIKP